MSAARGASHAQDIGAKRIPSSAVFHGGRSYSAEKLSPERKECRSVLGVTLAQVRYRFATWIEVTGMDYDLGGYVYLDCGRRGTLTVNGRSYTWSIHPEDTLITNWPDGEMHWYVRRLLSPDE